MGFIGVIISIVVGLVVLGFLYGLIGLLMAKFPFLIWTLGIIGGLIAGIASGRVWVGLLVGFLLIGFLSMAQEAGGHKCAHCGSYDTYVASENEGAEAWRCNKCGGVTGGPKRR